MGLLDSDVWLFLGYDTCLLLGLLIVSNHQQKRKLIGGLPSVAMGLPWALPVTRQLILTSLNVKAFGLSLK